MRQKTPSPSQAVNEKGDQRTHRHNGRDGCQGRKSREEAPPSHGKGRPRQGAAEDEKIPESRPDTKQGEGKYSFCDNEKNTEKAEDNSNLLSPGNVLTKEQTGGQCNEDGLDRDDPSRIDRRRVEKSVGMKEIMTDNSNKGQKEDRDPISARKCP